MEWDALLLSRIQFAFVISFHIIFPAFTIGLASYLAVLEGAWLWTKNPAFKNLYLFWVKVFAIAFGMGVVSGVVMSYQFGTNWAVFADKGGNVLGPLLAFEVLTAFFLEATFLGVMLFGWKRVGPALHFVSTCAVAVGTLFSAFWILAANSWMQTPAGFEVRDGLLYATDFWAVIFNPSTPSRFAHMVAAAYLSTALVVLGAAAWMALRGGDTDESRIMRRMAILMIALVAPMQLVIGHESGTVAYRYQPAKVAAMEGWWETKARQPTVLFAIPDSQNERNVAEIGLPGWGSWVVGGDSNAVMTGLKEFKPEDRPPVMWVFWSFRIMVGLGLLMIALGLWGGLLWFLGFVDRSNLFHMFAFAMGPSGFVAVLAGWFAAEIGRQPYVVYGVLRTADAVSPVKGEHVALSLLVFFVAYAIVFTTGALYILRLLYRGPSRQDDVQVAPSSAPGSPLGATPTVAAGK